jgi:hypothetical protein
MALTELETHFTNLATALQRAAESPPAALADVYREFAREILEPFPIEEREIFLKPAITLLSDLLAEDTAIGRLERTAEVRKHFFRATLLETILAALRSHLRRGCPRSEVAR